jgi:hypothetical protein
VFYAIAAAVLIAVTAYLASGLFGGSPAVPNPAEIVGNVDDVEDNVILPAEIPWLPEKNRMAPASHPQSSPEDSLEF